MQTRLTLIKTKVKEPSFHIATGVKVCSAPSVKRLFFTEGCVKSPVGIGISGSLNQTTTTQGVSRVKTVQSWTPAPNPGLMCLVIITTSASVKWTPLTLTETGWMTTLSLLVSDRKIFVVIQVDFFYF